MTLDEARQLKVGDKLVVINDRTLAAKVGMTCIVTKDELDFYPTSSSDYCGHAVIVKWNKEETDQWNGGYYIEYFKRASLRTNKQIMEDACTRKTNLS